MSFYAEPRYSKARVDRAGYAAGKQEATPEDIEIIENWRAAHAQLLNTFKQIIYNRAKKFDFALVVQRLKRRPTIIDKLGRDPEMRVRLSQMQDIAGCRVILDTIEDLYRFKELMDNARFDHEIRDEKDYLENPKPDGYRGIHQIFIYQVEPRKGHASENQPWNGMRIEVQYRTITQHAWATAVETAGLLTADNPKFKRGSKAVGDFFAVCSEMIARRFEHSKSSLPSLTNRDLCGEFDRLSTETHILDIFENVNTRIQDDVFSKNSILIFYFEPEDGQQDVVVRSFSSINSAISEYNRLENELSGKADVVLVKSEAEDYMRSAYRNYFADTAEFVRMIRTAYSFLSEVEEPGDGAISLI